MKTFNPELDVQNDRTSIQSTDCSAFEQQLLQLAKKLEEFGKTRLHMERYGPTTNVVLSVYVFLAYCVLRQKTKLPVTSGTSFKMPTGTCVNSRLLTKFVEYFGLEWHRSAFGKLNELLTALIIHANELSWVHNCDATNILRYVETVLQRYPSLEVEVKVSRTVDQMLSLINQFFFFSLRSQKTLP